MLFSVGKGKRLFDYFLILHDLFQLLKIAKHDHLHLTSIFVKEFLFCK